MKLQTGLSKRNIITQIDNHPDFDSQQKDVLHFLMDIESHILNYTFGLDVYEDIICDVIYTEFKNYIIPALLTSDWQPSFRRREEDDLYTICLHFSSVEAMDDFLYDGTFKRDNRDKFDFLEIILDKRDVPLAFERGLITRY